MHTNGTQKKTSSRRKIESSFMIFGFGPAILHRNCRHRYHCRRHRSYRQFWFGAHTLHNQQSYRRLQSMQMFALGAHKSECLFHICRHNRHRPLPLHGKSHKDYGSGVGNGDNHKIFFCIVCCIPVHRRASLHINVLLCPNRRKPKCTNYVWMKKQQKKAKKPTAWKLEVARIFGVHWN